MTVYTMSIENSEYFNIIIHQNKHVILVLTSGITFLTHGFDISAHQNFLMSSAEVLNQLLSFE
jgi:hypothetical protein